MFQFALTAVRAGLRSRSFIALASLGFIGMGLVLFTSLFASRHPDTLALDVGISVVRLVALLMVLFWTQDLVSREIDRKAVLLILAYPVPRAHYMLGRYFGILFLSACAVALLAVQMLLAVKLARIDYVQVWPTNQGGPLLATLFFIWIEMALVAAVTVALSAISTTPFLPFALGAAFAVIAKSIGPVLDYVAISQARNPGEFASLHPILNGIRWLLPDTSRLDLRVAPLYNQLINWNDAGWAVLMALAYACLVLGFGILGFRRREFR